VRMRRGRVCRRSRRTGWWWRWSCGRRDRSAGSSPAAMRRRRVWSVVRGPSDRSPFSMGLAARSRRRRKKRYEERGDRKIEDKKMVDMGWRPRARVSRRVQSVSGFRYTLRAVFPRDFPECQTSKLRMRSERSLLPVCWRSCCETTSSTHTGKERTWTVSNRAERRQGNVVDSAS
jgi:hypothetical protein